MSGNATRFNLGIGTTSPQTRLHIEQTHPNRIRLDSTSATPSQGIEMLESGIYKAVIQRQDNNQLAFYVGDSTTRDMVILDGGNLGIGTTGPGGRLDVVGSGTVVPLIVSTGTAAGSEVFRINSSGNVGIGTTSPAYKLHVSKTGAAGDTRIVAEHTGTTVNDNDAGFRLIGGKANAQWDILTNREDLGGAADSLAFYKVAGTVGTKMVINNAGNLGIGTTGPTQRLDVTGQIRLSTSTVAAQAGTISWDGANFRGFDGTTWKALDVQAPSGGGWTEDAPGNSIYTTTLGRNVGIGTTSPGAKLHVDYGTSNNVLKLTTNQNDFIILNRTAGTEWHIGNASQDLVFATGDIGAGLGYKMVIEDASGNVGIGATSPAARLHVSSASAVAADTIFQASSGTAVGQELMVIKGDGKVGIGTTGPGEKLDIRDGNLILTDADIIHGVTGFAPTNAVGKIYGYNATTGGLAVQGFSDTASGPWGVAISGMLSSDPTDTVPAVLIAGSRASGTGQAPLASAETVLQVANQIDGGTALMTVLGSGNVGIGTTGPTARLHVSTTGVSGTTNVVQVTTGTASASDVFVIKGDGNVGIGTMSPQHALHVVGTGGVGLLNNRAVNFRNAADSAVAGNIYVDTSDRLVLNNNALVINGMAGNVGIGTTVPATLLDVNGNAQFGSGATKSTFTATGALNLASGAALTLAGAAGNVTSASSVTASAFFGRGEGITGTTAAALAADPADCAAGSAATGINATGTATGCFVPAGIPTGFVGYFELAACPTGWTALAAAQGRYLVGLPAAGTLSGITGTALTNLENRSVGTHSHSVTDPGHSHVTNIGAVGGGPGFANNRVIDSTLNTNSGTTGVTIDTAGPIAGTNAPYLQLLVCKKD